MAFGPVLCERQGLFCRIMADAKGIAATLKKLFYTKGFVHSCRTLFYGED